MYASTESSRRLSPTERQQAEAAGADLLALLCSITADGQIQPAEVERLRDWLFAHAAADLPAVTFLTKIVVRIRAAGAISQSEATELYLAIERVLPITERGIARERRELAGEPAEPGSQNGGDWRNDPMTAAQGNFIKRLGGAIAADARKGEASRLIDQLFRKKPLSSRQQMVLRFWNRQPEPDEGPREVSEWQDLFYVEDPDRQAAWEQFESESGDNGLQGDPLRVPVGVGPDYLARVKKGGSTAVPESRPDSNVAKSGAARPGVRWLLGLAAAGAVVAIWFFVSRPPPPRAAAPIRPVEVRAVTPAPPPVVISLPAAPKVAAPPVFDAAAELKSFAGTIHFTALLTVGGEPVAMINGVRCRVGAKIGRAGSYTVTEVNLDSRSVVLTDRQGNSVRRLIE